MKSGSHPGQVASLFIEMKHNFNFRGVHIFHFQLYKRKNMFQGVFFSSSKKNLHKTSTYTMVRCAKVPRINFVTQGVSGFPFFPRLCNIYLFPNHAKVYMIYEHCQGWYILARWKSER